MRCLLVVVSFFAVAFSAEKLVKGSAGPCILGKCPDGFMCAEQLCVPDLTKLEKIGSCVNGLCPDSYFCHNDSCLRPIPKKRAGTTAIGPCVNQQCPNKHFCLLDENKCYPL